LKIVVVCSDVVRVVSPLYVKEKCKLNAKVENRKKYCLACATILNNLKKNAAQEQEGRKRRKKE
jgi:hypothetical protein